MRNNEILNYEEAYEQGINKVGGKAYSICKLYKNAIKVPNGYILSKELWNTYCENKDKKIIDNVVDFIKNNLKARTFVVRSSAIGEDSKEYSWAGCFESILDVSIENMSSAIIQCGKSLYGDRARMYKKLHKEVNEIKEIGILIQEYIKAEWSGVAFSVNPVTENRNECIIEAQKSESGSVVGGYGEAITLTLNRDSRDFSDIQNVIPENIASLIYNELIKIEKIWNTPVDIEWVIKENKIYITQTRPITTI